MSTEGKGSTFSAESYYATQPSPSSLDHDISGVREFVSRQASKGRNVVLVTVSPLSEFTVLARNVHIQSGGTTVPLELNV